MNILTPTEISECLTGGPTTVARAIEAAVIKRLAAGLSVEPVAYLAWRNGKPAWDREDCVCEDDVYPTELYDTCTSMAVFTIDQLNTERAAARVQALSEAMQAVEQIRALLGKEVQS